MSPRKFANPAVLVIPTSQITLDFVQTLQNYQHVSVKVKVANVDPKVQVKPGLYKQDVVSSHTLARTLEEDTSYQLDNFVINSFANVKYLSPQKSDSPCDIHAIADIGTVDNTEPLSSNTVIANAEVTGVSYIGTHNACLSCKAKVDPLNDVSTKCTMSIEV